MKKVTDKNSNLIENKLLKKFIEVLALIGELRKNFIINKKILTKKFNLKNYLLNTY